MNAWGKVLFSEFLKAALLPIRIRRVNRRKLLFAGLTGGNGYQYSCNPKYLCEYLMAQNPGDFEIVWVVDDPSRYAFLEEKGIKLVKHFTLRSFVELLTAKVIVTSGSYAPWFPFRKQQYVINIWHGGGAYKRIENDRPDANWATRKRARFCAENIDLFVSSCKMASEKLIRGTFYYDGEILEVGTPRNDFLVNGDLTQAVETVRRTYGIKAEEKILLYAPTYRFGKTEVVLDADRLLKELERDGSKWRFLFRAHRYQDERMKLRVSGERVELAGDYPDMQELLAAADLMITDYSSNFWDYSFLCRPCFYYAPDLEEYLKDTGFYVDMQHWPFPVSKDQDQLIEQIRAYDAELNREKIREHLDYMGNYEKGYACEKIAERILQVSRSERGSIS